MKPTDLHERSISNYPDQADLLRAWASDGDEQARDALLEWAPTVPARRIKTPDGPVFWYGSGAIANQRLFELRLAACYGGDLDAALARAAAKRECAGELTVITARLADAAGVPALGTLTERRAEGLFWTLPRVAPGRFADNLSSLQGKGAYKAWYKLALLGLVPWERSVGVVADGAFAWVAAFDRAVVTVRGSVEGRKASVAVKVAKTDAKKAATWDKAVSAAEKKSGLSLVDGTPAVENLTLPAAEDIDLGHALNAARRDQLIRGLPVQPRDRWPRLNSAGSSTAVPLAFELVRAGSRLEDHDDDTRSGLLDRLHHALLPGHYEALLGEAPPA